MKIWDSVYICSFQTPKVGMSCLSRVTPFLVGKVILSLFCTDDLLLFSKTLLLNRFMIWKMILDLCISALVPKKPDLYYLTILSKKIKLEPKKEKVIGKQILADWWKIDKNQNINFYLTKEQIHIFSKINFNQTATRLFVFKFFKFRFLTFVICDQR